MTEQQKPVADQEQVAQARNIAQAALKHLRQLDEHEFWMLLAPTFLEQWHLAAVDSALLAVRDNLTEQKPEEALRHLDLLLKWYLQIDAKITEHDLEITPVTGPVQ